MDLNTEQLEYCIGLATDMADRYARQYPNSNATDPERDTESLLVLCGERVARSYPLAANRLDPVEVQAPATSP